MEGEKNNFIIRHSLFDLPARPMVGFEIAPSLLVNDRVIIAQPSNCMAGGYSVFVFNSFEPFYYQDSSLTEIGPFVRRPIGMSFAPSEDCLLSYSLAGDSFLGLNIPLSCFTNAVGRTRWGWRRH